MAEHLTKLDERQPVVLHGRFVVDAMLAVEFDFVGLLGIATKGIAENIYFDIYFETAKRESDFVVPLIDRDVAVGKIDSSRLALVEVRFDFSDRNSSNQSMLGKVPLVWPLASDSVDLLVIGRLKPSFEGLIELIEGERF